MISTPTWFAESHAPGFVVALQTGWNLKPLRRWRVDHAHADASKPILVSGSTSSVEGNVPIRMQCRSLGVTTRSPSTIESSTLSANRRASIDSFAIRVAGELPTRPRSTNEVGQLLDHP